MDEFMLDQVQVGEIAETLVEKFWDDIWNRALEQHLEGDWCLEDADVDNILRTFIDYIR